VPGLVIALVAYYVMGMQFQGAHLDAAKINEVLGVLNKSFVITPWLLRRLDASTNIAIQIRDDASRVLQILDWSAGQHLAFYC